MLRRFISVFLCAVMVFSVLPVQAFAEESIGGTEAVQLPEPTVTETLVTEPEETETEATIPEFESTEPVATESEPTEPVATESESTEPEETESEDILLEETKSETVAAVERVCVPQTPMTYHNTFEPRTFSKTEDVRVITQDENGNIRYYDTTETTTSTVNVKTEYYDSPVTAANLEYSNGFYSFTTFADLKELAAQSYSDYTFALYKGEEALTIEEDLTLPANLRLGFCDDNSKIIINEGVAFGTSDDSNSITVDSLIIHGTFTSRGLVTINQELTVNGSLLLYDRVYLNADAAFSCGGTIRFANEYSRVVREYSVDNLEDFKSAAEKANADSSGVYYEISLRVNNDITLTESVTVPSNVVLNAYSRDSYALTIAEGCTFELNCEEYASLNVELMVDGTLKNNCRSLNAKKITFSDSGRYSGKGILYFSTSDPTLTLEDFVTGLDMTNIEVTEERYPDSDWYYWELRDITGLVKLGTPTGLQWNKELRGTWNGNTQEVEYSLVSRKGCIAWKTAEPDQGHADIVVYKQGQENVFDRYSWYFGSTYMPEYRSIDSFILSDPESGTYHFTVQSTADGTGYYNSDIATSGTWKYTKPSKSLGSCSNLTWDWPMVRWDGPIDRDDNTEYEVKFYYAATAYDEPRSVGGSWGMYQGSCDIWDELIQGHGTGYYYFRVRAISGDITVKCNGAWSELSAAYNLNQLTQGVRDTLTDIANNTSDADEIREAVQAIDTESLRSAMLADTGTEGVVDTLTELENAVGGAAGVQVTNEASAFDADKVTIVGANLNNAAAESEDPITLVIDKPEREHLLEAAYDNSVAVSFAMTLENVADAENLDVPVKITMPVPAGINPDFLVILHYKQDGTVEELVNGVDVHIFRDGDEYYASFVLTSFSDFVMTHQAENVEDSGTTSFGISWQFTNWNELTISGTGAMDDYESAEDVPWAQYRGSITSVTIQEGVTHIGTCAFMAHTSLTSVSMADSVTSIGADAFRNCERLPEITIGAGVTEIGDGTFAGDRGLTEIHVAAGNEAFASVDGVLFRKNMTTLVAYPSAKAGSVYTVPDGITTIGAYAIYNSRELTEVILPDSLGTIEEEAFSNCRGLKRIVFQGDPVSIAETAFENVVATVYYPAVNKNWTKESMLDYGGTLTWLPSCYVEVTGETEVPAGKTIKLTAKILPENSTGAKITWALAKGDEMYATLKTSGNTATITALDVSEQHTITVIAKAGESIAPCEYKLTLNPKVKQLKLYEVYLDDGEEREVDLSDREWWHYKLDESNQTGFSVQLKVVALPDGANSKVTWKSSNTGVATINSETGEASFTGEAGVVKFTATSVDDGSVKAEVTYKAVKMISAEAVGDTTIELTAGQSKTLQVRNKETGKVLSTKNIEWSLYSEDGNCEAYASIDKSGKLTTKKVMEKVSFNVRADVLVDGVSGDSVEYTVTLYPATTHVEVFYDDVLANGQTVLFNLNDPQSKTLSVKLYPDDAMGKPVRWSNSDAKKEAYAHYELDEETGTITISEPTKKTGTVTFAATAQDGSKKSAAVKVQFAAFATSLEITNTEDKLAAGSTLILNAEVGPESITKPGVVWSLKNPADKAYVSLSGNKLTAKTVYGDHAVTVVASSKDGCVSDEYTIIIVPKDTDMLILRDESGENVTMCKVYVDLNKDPSVTLSAHTYGTNEEEKVTWSPSVNSKNASVSLEDGKLKVTMLSGSLNVKAETADGRRANVTIVAAKLASEVTIETKDGKNMTMDGSGDTIVMVASGKSVNLKAILKDASSSKVAWSVTEGREYAQISTSGKLTAAKDITSEKKVVVCATAQDGSNVSDKVAVIVKPLAQGLQIYSEREDTGVMLLSVFSNECVRGNTTLVWDMAAEDADGNARDTIEMSALVYPFYNSDEARSAIQEVTWKSSSPKVAEIDSNGKITCLKAGTVTITATAADGSGQKVSFKLTVVKRIKGLTLKDAVVAGGKSITLMPVVAPSDATNKKLTWFMTGDTAFATLSNGKLTTKKVTSVKTVEIFAIAQDGSGVHAACEVKIYPAAATSVQILQGTDDVTGKTLTMRAGETLTLTGKNLPDRAGQAWIWSSSSPENVSVEEGIVTAHKAGKTVNIVCTAADGSGKKATVKITVVA